MKGPRLPKSSVFNALALLLVLIGFSLFVPQASAEYSISLREDGISVVITADFAQGVPNISSNVTRIFTEIPAFTIRLEGNNASLIAEPLNEAVKTKTPAATASQVEISASSNGTWMHYDLRFKVQNSFTNQQDVFKSDLAWRSLVIPTDIVVASYSINRLLPTYLGDEVIGLTQEGPFPIQQQRSWYLNGDFRSSSQIISSVPSLILFNFTSLSRPLEEWTATRDIGRAISTWRASTGFNLTFIGRLVDPEAILVFARTAIYNLETVIEAPGLAKASGDLILFETVNSYAPQYMVATILALGTLLIGTTVVERRYQRPNRRAGKNRR